MSSKTVDECRNCYEKDEIIIQLDRRLCEIRRRVIETKQQSVSGNNFVEGEGALVSLIYKQKDLWLFSADNRYGFVEFTKCGKIVNIR